MYDGRSTATITVRNLTLSESGTYNPQVSRPYETHVDGTTYENIARRIDSCKGNDINSFAVAGVANSILHPSATPQGEIVIPMGWSERRIRFVMEVEAIGSTGNHNLFFIQGFTDRLGISAQGSIDPNMVFYINSYIRVNRTHTRTPYGLQAIDTVSESAHVINGQIIQQSACLNNAMAMRPEDIFVGIDSAHLEQSYKYHHNTDGTFYDTRYNIQGNNIRSNRSNSLPSSYMAKILDGYQTGCMTADFGQGKDGVHSRAKGVVQEGFLQDNIFLRQLSNIKGVPNATSFTVNDLQRLDPNIGNVTNYVTMGSTVATQMHSAGQTAYWNSVDRETVVATVLSNAVPAIMMELMIRKITFRATNHVLNDDQKVVIIHALGMSNADMSRQYALFMKRIEKEVLFDLTFGNSEAYLLEMTADMFGDTTITLQWNSGPAITYNTPSFCDGLLVPVVTGNKDNFYNVVSDFERLFTAVGIEQGSRIAINNQV